MLLIVGHIQICHLATLAPTVYRSQIVSKALCPTWRTYLCPRSDLV